MLKVQDVYKAYPKHGGVFLREKVPVISGVSFELKQGECIGVIGESGSGKTTLSRLIMGLEKPDKGLITMDGEKIDTWKKKNKGQMSVVFQEYTSSINPRFSIKNIIEEPMIANNQKDEMESKVLKLIDKVGLSQKILDRYPHEISGGQLQRVCIARAISTNPRFIILDEAVSSLDVSIQFQILTLLKELKKELNLTYLFISHDIQAIASLCDNVVFLHQGKIQEKLCITELANTKNPFAKKILSSIIAFEVNI